MSKSTLNALVIAGAIALGSCASSPKPISAANPVVSQPVAQSQSVQQAPSSSNLENKVSAPTQSALPAPTLQVPKAEADPRTTNPGNPVYSLEKVTILGENYFVTKTTNEQMGGEYLVMFREDRAIRRLAQVGDEMQESIISGEGGVYFARPLTSSEGRKVDYMKIKGLPPTLEELTDEQKENAKKIPMGGKEYALPYQDIPHLGKAVVLRINEQENRYSFILNPKEGLLLVLDPANNFYAVGNSVQMLSLEKRTWKEIENLRQSYAGKNKAPEVEAPKVEPKQKGEIRVSEPIVNPSK